MPLPLIPIVWGGGLALSALGLLAWRFSKKDVVKGTQNKKVIFLGLAATGKSTLLHVIEKGTIPETTVITGGRKVFTPKIEGGLLGFILSQNDDLIDYSGANLNTTGDFLKDWIGELNDVDIIFYLFNIGSLYSEEREVAMAAIDAEIDRIRDKVNSDNNKHPFFFLIGSYADHHPEQKSSEEIKAEIKSNEFGKKIMRKIKGINSDNVKDLYHELFLVGQLNNHDTACKLIGEIVAMYTNQTKKKK